MFKDLEIMKTLRYLLIVVGLVSVLSVYAQTLAQRPEAKMQSTSVMMSSGSNLPQAAVEGVSTVGSANEQEQIITGPRRSRPGDWTDPYKDPIGDAGWPLAICALAYVLYRYVRMRTRALNR